MRTPLRRRVIAGALFAAVLVPAAASAHEDAVVIRTYDASGLPEADLDAALAAAFAILEDAGVPVARLSCDQPDEAARLHPCRAPLAPHELSLRLVRLPPDGIGPVTLGYSLVETPAGFGSLATVYVDRVARLAAAARVDVPTVLGRAIAHEIGHLLLGTNAHARAGVMRAVWSPEAVRASTPRDWRFTTRDTTALRDGARRRTSHPVQTW